MDWFKHVYVISLPTRVDRRKHIERVFSAARIRYRLFDARTFNQVPARYLDTWLKFEDKYVLNDWKLGPIKNITKKRVQYGQNAFGCLYSHIVLCKMLMKAGWPYMMVFEDDVVIHPNFVDQVEDFIQKVPDTWQLIRFGGAWRVKTHYPVDLGNGVFHSRGVLGTHAYLLRAEGAKKLLEIWETGGHTADDGMAVFDREAGETYLPYPLLAIQAKNHSDIAQEVVISSAGTTRKGFRGIGDTIFTEYMEIPKE
jgi:GR25 family glycosyltransferase involved in LPS biosynthesis